MRPALLTTGILFAFAAVVGAGAPEAAARPTCGGKVATIVSNAPRIVGTKGHDVIVGGPGANRIFGLGGNDTICGGGGDDRIFGGRGNDRIYGDGGDDMLRGGRGSDRLYGGGGTDALFGDTGNDRLFGGAGDRDRLYGGAGDDSLDGGGGDFDLLVGGTGVDRLDGGPGRHDIASFEGNGGSVWVDLGAGLARGPERESIRRIDDVIGGHGDDTIVASSGAPSRLDGGPGDDRLVAAHTSDQAFGGPGNDNCVGPFASQTGCDREGRARASTSEVYTSIAGHSTLVVTGTDGDDRIEVNSAEGASAIVASLGPGDDFFAIGPNVPASVSVVIDGGPGSDVLRGGAGDDIIYGGDDRDPDTLEGGPGDDVLFGVNIFHPRRDSGAARMIGGPGNDLMVGGQPCNGDLFDGGPGDNDSASFARVRNSGIYVHATIGGAVFDPDVGNCNAGRIESNVEKIEGSPGPDILNGDNGDNVLLGRGGNDVLNGKGGMDRCIGGGGRNRTSNCELTDWRTPVRIGYRNLRR